MVPGVAARGMTAVLDPAGVPGVPASIGAYDAWLEVNRPTGRARADLQRRLDAAAARLPQISVVMPVYDPPLEFFDRAIESVHVQIFARWQLCIADDASPDPRARARMADWAARDHRIATTNLPHNVNISAATNSAAALATGEFLAFLDQDDELEADALAEVALHLADHPDCDLLYTDDDKVDSAGRRFDPQFKPAWSPILLLGYSYTSHLLVVRRRLFQALGGFRQGFEGSQDYDFVLRAAEQARQIGHIPRILYHWRVLPGSTAQAGDAKPQAFEAGRLAVADALARRGWPGDVTHPAHARAARVGIFDIAFHHDGPSVAVIVMAGDRVAAARRCLDGLTRTAYRNFRVVVVAHGARAAEFSALAASQIDVLCSSEPGSSAGIYATANAAARAIDAEFLLFLDADIEVESDAWLSQMVGLASLPDSGAVGARVLTPDRCIVEAGIVVSNGKPAPAFQGGPGDDWGYLGYVRVSRECSAISGQCLLTRRDLFLSLGGFDQARFASAFADIDYCLRLIRAGCRNLYCAQAVVIKHDEAPGGQAPDPADRSAFRKRWGA
ncbi:MAG: glycosyltransferase, partial [Alphaproteobacteria bacterium]|nr:glycosyltransferase [Alphaproteobacteria bacterium]